MEPSRPYRVKDIGNKRFGRLIVKKFSHIKNNHSYWVCICDCGKECTATGCALREGSCASCGCLKDENGIKHGMCKTRIYRIWQSMLGRCHDIENKDYGGKGISVCEEWLSFINFYDDTKEGYADNLTLDRYPDKNGNYNKNNFRWATMTQQNRNKNINVFLEYNGERLSRIEWSEKLGLNSDIIRQRLRLGWAIERVLTEPVKIYCKSKNQFSNNKKEILCLQESL